jgi:HTH-type transcriptional regulator/antitoxin HigA
MVGFARSIGVHPGLVAGQLQHLTGRYERFRQHLEKVRSHVLKAAYVDGWGDVAPVGE